MRHQYISVEDLPGLQASVVFIPTELHFREEKEIVPLPIPETDHSYIPWGADNQLPYRMVDRFESDETLSSCLDFITEVTYAGGLNYVSTEANTGASASASVVNEESDGIPLSVDDFLSDNDLAAYWAGVTRDMKMYSFAVTVLILSEDGRNITNIYRKEAASCRFSPATEGYVPYVHYSNWRLNTAPGTVESIPLLDPRRMRSHLKELALRGERKAAVLTVIPGAEAMYYPIPTYGSIFRGKWYNIKQFIGIAKEAKLKNSAPIKYIIEVSEDYWENLFQNEHITDPVAQAERVVQVKQDMVNFLTGAKNSGKAIFSTFRTSIDGKESHDIKITKIESDTEGGDWATDHAEAINMLCFAMRVHSNLVGSVPGKTQNNNSGSDKRELYTISQVQQTLCRDLLMRVHKFVIRYNRWQCIKPHVPVIQLTTLDQHKDMQKI